MFNQELQEISAGDIKTLQDQQNALLLDVLPPEHYQLKHLPGAHNACVYEMDFFHQVQTLCPDTSSPIILYGAGLNSFDSRVAADKLLQGNYKRVMIFPGGLKEWTDTGYGLEGDNPEVLIAPHPVLDLHKDSFEVLPDESMITWTGRNASGRHTGTVDICSGTMQGSVEKITGNFIMDMTSITDIDLAGDELKPVLETHLKSDDFFFTTLYPKCKLAITDMVPIPGRAPTQYTYSATGTLSLRGMHKDIVFDAHLHNLDENKITLIAHFDLDRTRWGILYGSARFFEHLSYHLVYDLISIEARIVMA